ncbi:mucin-binding protein [Lacticaseibacillus absianus]|uniref:mucin-binding protein n=1 Tax=Lacticaseibacillus absianus TaxID=2729623 RepID=UPI0015CE8102
MLEKLNKQHERVVRDTAETHVRYKLYKRGRNWVVAGLMTVVFGLGAFTAPRIVRADEAVAPPISAVKAEDETSSAEASDVVPDQVDDVVSASSNVAIAPPVEASTEHDEAEAAPAVATADPEPEALAAAEAATSAAPTPEANSASTPEQPASDVTTAAEPTVVAAAEPLPAPAPLAAAVPAPAGVITAPRNINNSAAIREQARLAALALTTSIEGASNYATSTNGQYRVITRWIGNSANLTQAQITTTNLDYRGHPIVPNYQLNVTNVREVDGVIQLTPNSVITVTIPVGTVVGNTTIHNYAFNVIGYPSLNLAPIGAGYTADPTKPTVTNSLQGDMSVYTWHTLTLSASVSVSGGANNIGAEGVMVYFKTPLAPYAGTQDFQPSVILAYFDAPTSYQLTPKITSPLTNAATLSGTGTATGDTITVRAIGGSQTVQTTVGLNGTWSVNLAAIGLTANQDLYVVESNTLGDEPGGYIVQHATATRTINYRDAAGNTVSPSVTQTLNFTRSGFLNPTTMAADYGAWTADASSTFVAVGSPNLGDKYTTTKTVGALAVTDPTAPARVVNVIYNPLFATIGPDDSNTTGVALETLRREVTKTIHYVNDDGTQAAPDSATTLSFTRVATVNLETKRVVGYTAWTAVTENAFAAIVSPSIMTKIASKFASQVQTVSASDLNNPTISYEETIVYFPDQVRIEPGIGADEGDAVSGDDEDPRRYPESVSTAELTRVIKETVRYIDASTGNEVYDDDVFELTYTRGGIIRFDYDTAGQLVATPTLADWEPSQSTFQAVIGPSKDGFVIAGDIEAVTTTPETADLTRTVWYYPQTELVHTVTVTTTFDMPVTAAVQRQTIDFSRQLILTLDVESGDTTVSLGAWTPDVAGTELVAALGTNMPMPDNGDPVWAAGWRAAVVITVNDVPVGDGTDQAIQLNRTTATGDSLAVTLNGLTTEIDRLVTYTDTLIHIRYIDMNDGGRVIAVIHTTETQTDPTHYGDTLITVGPATGSYHLEIDAANMADENGSIVDGNERFTAQPGQTVTVELRHKLLVEPLSIRRGIRYVVEDGAVEPEEPFVIQTASWEQITDLYAQAYGDQLSAPVEAIIYRQLSGYLALPTPVIPEYVASQDEIVAVGPAPGTTSLRPTDNLTFEVIYTRNVFTPANPGSEKVSAEVTWTIAHIDALTGQPLTVPGYVPAELKFTRTVTVNTDGTKTYADWTPETTEKFTDYVVPDITDYVHTQGSLLGGTVDGDSGPQVTTVKYYPAVVTVTPDQPQTLGTATIADDDESPRYPAGVSADDLNRTLTRTIVYWDVLNGTVLRELSVQTVKFERVGTVTFVQDGLPVVTYGDWQPVTETFQEVVLDPADKEIGELFTLQTKVSAMTVGASDADLTEHVNYYPTTVTIQPDQPVTQGDELNPDDEFSPEYPSGLQRDDLNRSVTQTIRFVDPVKNTELQPSVVAGSLDFNRVATVNLQSGEVIYGEWTPVTADQFPAFTAIPTTLNDLTADKQTLAPTSPLKDGELANVTETVNYVRKPIAEIVVTPDDPKNEDDDVFPDYVGVQKYPDGVKADDLNRIFTRIIHYLNGMDGTTPVTSSVTQTLTYSRRATIKYALDDQGNLTGEAPEVIYGDWTAVAASEFVSQESPVLPDLFTTKPTTTALTPTQDQVEAGTPIEQKVFYYPVMVTINPDDPRDEGVINSEDPDSPEWSSGLTAKDLNTAVIEQITFVGRRNGNTTLYSDQNGTVRGPLEKMLDFTRQATLNLQTGAVGYTDWQGVTDDNFAAVTLPETLYDDEGDEYVPLDPEIAAIALDLTQTELAPIISRIALYGMPPYKTLEIGPQPPVAVDDPTGPKNAGDLTNSKDTLGQQYPAGLTAADLNVTVTLIGRYIVSDGGAPAPAETTLTLAFERGATVTWTGETDEELAKATGVVVYHPWRAVTKDLFDTVTSPTLADYFADLLAVADRDGLAFLNAKDKFDDQVPLVVEVTYYPTTVTVTPDKPAKAGDPVITDQVDGPKYPGGVDEDALHQTVTRVITRINGATGAVIETITQTLHFDREATLTYTSVTDLPTPTYSEWAAVAGEDGEFDQYTPVTVVDMIADKAEIAAAVPTVDEIERGQVDPEDVWYYPSIVVVTPDQPGIAEEAVFPQGPSPVYPSGVTADDLNRTLTRVITYVNVQTGAVLGTASQTLNFKRTATLVYTTIADKPTPGYSAWTPVDNEASEFEQIAVPSFDGVIALQPTVAAQTPTQAEIAAGDELPVTVNFFPTTITVTPDRPGPEGEDIFPGIDGPTYPAGTDTADLTKTVERQIIYHDAVSGVEALAETQTLTFTRTATLAINADGTVTVTGYSDWAATEDTFASFTVAPQPDRVANRNTVAERTPTKAELDSEGPVLIERVYFYPTTITVGPDNPGVTGEGIFPEIPGPEYPAGVEAKDLTKTVTRTITYVDAMTGDAALATTQTLTFTRTAVLTVNADGTATFDRYSEWTAVEDTFASFDVAPKPDRIASAATVAAYAPTQDELNGDRTFAVTVYFYPTTVTVGPDNPGVTGEAIFPEIPGPEYPAGVEAKDLTKTVTRTITYVDAITGDQALATTQSLTFTRKANLAIGADGKAMFTGYTDWTADDDAFDRFDVVARPDRLASQDVVAAYAPTQQELDEDVPFAETVYFYPTTVIVTPEKPGEEGTEIFPEIGGPTYPGGVTAKDLNRTVTREIIYLNATTGVEITRELQTLAFTREATLTFSEARTDATVSYGDWTAVTSATFAAHVVVAQAGLVADRETVAAYAPTPAEIEAGQAPAVTVRFYAELVTVTPEQPHEEGDSVTQGEEAGPKYPSGVTAKDLNKTVTRTVTYVNVLTGATLGQPVTQTLTFKRDATIKYVAGGAPVVTYGSWQAVDADGHTFGQLAAPHFDGVLPLKAATAAHTLTEEEITAQSAWKELLAYYPQTITVTPDKPGTAGERIVDDPNSPLYPAGVDAKALNQQAIRTIHYRDQNGRTLAPSVTVTLGFHRSATLTFDEAGNVTVVYAPWQADTTNTFPAVTSPLVQGFVTTQTSLAARQVAGPGTTEEIVRYVPVKADPEPGTDPGPDTDSEPATEPAPAPTVKAAPQSRPAKTVGRLPQTGDRATTNVTALGLILLSLVGTLGAVVGKRRKRR